MRADTASRAVSTSTGVALRCARMAQHVHAVLARQAQVQQVQHAGLVGARLQFALCSDAVAHPVHRKTMLRQAGTDARAQQFIVFGQQDAHGWSLFSLWYG